MNSPGQLSGLFDRRVTDFAYLKRGLDFCAAGRKVFEHFGEPGEAGHFRHVIAHLFDEFLSVVAGRDSLQPSLINDN